MDTLTEQLMQKRKETGIFNTKERSREYQLEQPS